MAHITKELKSLTDKEFPFEEKKGLILIAGERGFISNLLPFVGNPEVDISLQLLIIGIAAKRERNQDLVWLLESRPMAPLVNKAAEEALFGNVNRASGKGRISDILLLSEGPGVPEMVRIHAKRSVAAAVERGIEKGYYLGFPDLLGKDWVPEEAQLKAFGHWETGRATDLDLELLLRRKSLCQPLTMRVVSALFKRGAASRVPEKLRLKKIREGKKEEQGLLLQLRDFVDPKRKAGRPPPMPVRNVQIRIIRRKVC